jgi:hypothetical protein
VEPSKIRLNAFQKSELKVFSSCVELDVQYIQCPVGIHFDTKEATYDNDNFKFNDGQRSVFDTLMEAKDDEARQKRAFFISAPDLPFEHSPRRCLI